MNFLKHKHNIWKVAKGDLESKVLYHQVQGIQKWQSVVLIEEYEDLFRTHYDCLVLEEETKKWMTVLSSKLRNEQSEVLCLQNK